MGVMHVIVRYAGRLLGALCSVVSVAGVLLLKEGTRRNKDFVSHRYFPGKPPGCSHEITGEAPAYRKPNSNVQRVSCFRTSVVVDTVATFGNEELTNMYCGRPAASDQRAACSLASLPQRCHPRD